MLFVTDSFEAFGAQDGECFILDECSFKRWITDGGLDEAS